MNNEKLMIFDGNSILTRAFYGIMGPQLLSTSDGLYTNAVYGFINILHKFVEEDQPELICVAFDMKAPTFRHREYEGYKAKRKAMPEELRVQVPVIKEVLDAMNIKRLEYEGFEADDIIGSVSLCAEKDGFDVVIITGDRDYLQLASDTTKIKLVTTRKGKTETQEYDYNRMIEEYGITPAQFIDVKALMGDASDNIPGVPGIGEKTALTLIKKYGSVEEIYNNLDTIERKSIREKLVENRDLAFMSKMLATIERNMPELCTIEDLRRKEFNNQELYELFKRLEFKSFIKRYNLESGNQGTQETGEIHIEYIDSKEDLEGLTETLSASEGFCIYHLIDKYDGHESKLIGAGLAWGDENQAYADLSGDLDEESFLAGIKALLEDDRVKKYGHDVKNLMVYLKNKNISLRGLAFDTMIGAYVLDPSRPTYTVSELAEEYLSFEVEPIEQLSGKGRNFTFFRDMPKETLSRVAATHARAVLMISGKLDRLIRENGQDELFYDIELPLSEVLADMEYHGFKVNIEELREFSSELDLRLQSLESEIYQLAGETFNINSTKQLGAVLFEKLELPVIKKTKTGYSTDAEVLEELSSRHPIIPRILEYRQLTKLKSTYAEGLINVINPKTGKIHSSFNQTVTATGRISSTEPNLQNIPVKLELGRKIRKVFVPSSEDYLLLDADYSQIELRVLAHITGDEHMIAAFENNEDIHASTAAKVFGVQKDKVDPIMRSRAKAINFGIVYGIGDFSLSKDLGITRKEARRYIDEYLNKYPGVRQYMHDIVEQGKTFGFVTTLFNRRRYLPELKSKNFVTRSFGERVAMNTPIQGSAADIIKIAMVNVHRELTGRKLKSRLILQVHDELIIETHKDEKEEVEAILSDSMENAVKLRVPLSVDVKSGSNWYETK